MLARPWKAHVHARASLLPSPPEQWSSSTFTPSTLPLECMYTVGVAIAVLFQAGVLRAMGGANRYHQSAAHCRTCTSCFFVLRLQTYL